MSNLWLHVIQVRLFSFEIAKKDIHEFLPLVVIPVVVDVSLQALHELRVVITFLLFMCEGATILQRNGISKLLVHAAEEQFDSESAYLYCGEVRNTGKSWGRSISMRSCSRKAVVAIIYWKELVRSMQSTQFALTVPFCSCTNCSPACSLTKNIPVDRIRLYASISDCSRKLLLLFKLFFMSNCR